jgi:hypothetical protein
VASPRSPGVTTSAPAFYFIGGAKKTEGLVRGEPAFVPMVLAGDDQTAAAASEASVIEFELGDVRIRITGRVDSSVLRQVVPP